MVLFGWGWKVFVIVFLWCWCYTDLFDAVCNIAIYAYDSIDLLLSVIWHLICGNSKNRLPNFNINYLTFWTVAGSGLLILIWGKLKMFYLMTWIPGANDVILDASIIDEKSSLKMLVLFYSSKLDWSSYIVSVAKTTHKKTGVSMCFLKFLCSEAVFISVKLL